MRLKLSPVNIILEATVKKLICLVSILVLSAVLTTTAMAKTYTVSFNQIVEHPALDALRKGVIDSLNAKGYHINYHVHIAEGNISTANLIARQIVGENPDVVVPIATPTAQACAQVIKQTPIVFAAVSDPVGAGLVKSLQHPGSNVTGTCDMSPVDRQVALIRQFLPHIKHLGVIYNSGEANSIAIVKFLHRVCAKDGIAVEEATVSNSSGVYQAAKSLVGKVEAIYIPTDNTVVSAFESITKVCIENKLPVFAADVDSVGRGAVAALAVDYYRMGLQTGDMVARVLQGAKPADMPVETLKNLMFYLNLKSAAEMGLKVPPALIKRADKIIR